MYLGWVGWVACAGLVGLWAHEHGRDGFVWTFIALVISPVLAGVIVLVLRDCTHDLLKERLTKEFEEHNRETERFLKKLREDQARDEAEQGAG